MAFYFEHTTCYVLAGGKSSRMGQDKGLLPVGEKKLIELLIQKIRPSFAEVCIVANDAAYTHFGCRVIPDVFQGIGPAGGIHAALADCQTQQLFILSCDMPFITIEGMAHLLAVVGRHDIVLPVHQQKIEPMFAVIQKTCATRWAELVEQGQYKLQEIMANFDTFALAVDGAVLFGEDFFFNVNTPEAFALAKKKLMQ